MLSFVKNVLFFAVYGEVIQSFPIPGLIDNVVIMTTKSL